MALRTTTAAVALIIEHDTAISMTPFIEVASALVDDVVDTSSNTYSSTKLELIERWLSAHFYALRDPRAISEKADVVSQKFSWKVDLMLSNTRYGQMALILDTEGNLAALSKRAAVGKKSVIGFNWLGTGNTYGDDTTE